MITAERLDTLIKLRAPELTSMMRESGYKGPAFSSIKFLGISNGGELTYRAVWLVEPGKSTDTDSTKIFVNHRDGRVSCSVDNRDVWAYN
jgi:hypothetical protein